MTLFAHKLRLITWLAALALLISNTASSFPQNRSSPQNNRQARETEAQAERWLSQLHSSDEEKRREAVMELSEFPDEAASSALAGALGDQSPRVRGAAAAAIGRRVAPSLAPALAECLAKDKSSFVRKMAAYALARFHGTERTAALISALKEKEAEVRGAAAVALRDHADTEAVAPLIAALSDKNSFVRGHAALALGVNGSAAAGAVDSLVIRLTSDEDGEVKRQAAQALGQIGSRAALPALERARHGKDPYLIQAATDAIALIEHR